MKCIFFHTIWGGGLVTAMDVILGLLHRHPLSGYEIRHTFQSLFSYFFDANYGTIYPTLGKLEKMGCITKETVPQDNRPAKHVYSLTEKGREQFRQYLRTPVEDDVYRSDFMVRLFFGRFMEPDSAIGLLKERLNKDKAELLDLENMKRSHWDHINPTQQLCLTIGIEQSKTKIRLLEDGLAQLNS